MIKEALKELKDPFASKRTLNKNLDLMMDKFSSIGSRIGDNSSSTSHSSDYYSDDSYDFYSPRMLTR